MLEIFDFLRGSSLTTLSIVLRLFLAVLCGGVIGLERERKRRPAGFRTHILICLGAAMATLTSQYLILELGFFADPARLGAQVIAGIGFIGAGAIIVTRRRQVKGLTTAAGLWVCAIVGLCCGAGFFEGAIITTIIILLAEIVFSRLEYYIISNSRAFNLYVEYSHNENLQNVIDTIVKSGGYIVDLEITKSSAERKNPSVVFSLQTPRRTSHQEIMAAITKADGVVLVEEL